MKRKGFTLIELLIVVAIIGILAAIAVPNFMNAQTRSKVARSYADMRSTMTGIEQLRLDKGVLLVDFWDDDSDIGINRILNDFGGVGHNGGAGNRNQLAVLSPLTSPVSYMGSVPRDPFAAKSGEYTDGHNERFGRAGNDAYLYIDEDPIIPGADHGGTTFDPELRPGDYVLFAFGPAAKSMYSGSEQAVRWGIPYDSSNGVVSWGDIMMRSGAGIVTQNIAGRKQW
ncbi:MAG: type IV pilin protein [bacterium]|jgi:prepilin-type N-terminal cleavage/methylation domain-containing protein